MQNSLDTLLTGLAASLQDTVLPMVEDPYAQGQLSAAIELLGNIASRVEWQPAYLTETVRRCRTVLEVAVAEAAPAELPESRRVLDEPLPGDGASLHECRDAHLRALAEVTAWCTAGRTAAQTGADAALRDFLGWQLRDEAARTKTGMYRSRLASAERRKAET